MAVLVFAVSLATELGVEAYFGDDRYYQTHAWPLAAALLVAAAVTWLWGSRLNRGPGRTVIDKQTGREEVLGGPGRHRLFFVPMQYWGPILAVGALVSLILR